jgi:hypothetical protein
MPFSGLLRRVALVRTDIPPKRNFLQEPRYITFQKTVLFIFAVVFRDFTHFFRQHRYFLDPSISFLVIRLSDVGEVCQPSAGGSVHSGRFLVVLSARK